MIGKGREGPDTVPEITREEEDWLACHESGKRSVIDPRRKKEHAKGHI